MILDVYKLITRMTMIASQICETPIANIVFIDKERQWVKSTVDWSSADT
jgi:hypothetical protein